jgi:hypothetical protein
VVSEGGYVGLRARYGIGDADSKAAAQCRSMSVDAEQMGKRQ